MRDGAPLLSWEEARAAVLGHALRPKTVRVLLNDAVGRVLHQSVRADRDVPPFDRSALDGFAVRVGERWNEEGQDLPVVARIAAGAPWRGTLPPGSAAAITTGSPVPAGADGVVPVERSENLGSDRVRLFGPLEGADRPGIAKRGEDARKGDIVLGAGTRLGPAEIAILAGIGRVHVPVSSRPFVDIFTTGDEIVDPRAKPRWDQIRNGNGPMLQAMLARSAWAEGTSLRRVPDRREAMERRIASSRASVLVFTGGVSMGTRDFVPDVLARAGFRVHVHGVAIRPGKPFLFATRGSGAAKLAAFGLPGNPVSALVTAWEFLLPYLRRSAGSADVGPRTEARLAAEPIERRPGLLHFVPVQETIDDEGRARVRPVTFHGSGDYVALGRADGFALLSAERPEVAAGAWIPTHFLDDEPRCRAATARSVERGR